MPSHFEIPGTSPVELPHWPTETVVTNFVGTLATGEPAVGFFGGLPERLNNFSFHRIGLLVAGQPRNFPSVEVGYHFFKFAWRQPSSAQLILQATSSMHAKMLARRLEADPPFDRAYWDTVKVPLMTALVATKVAQHPEVAEALTATGEALIFENAPQDSYWGIGPDGQGENLMGRIWMGLRSALADGRAPDELAAQLTREAAQAAPELRLAPLQPMPSATLERGTVNL